ncbi:MAG: hypothetical protein HC833_20470 [Leptolyngbyaceae cyanobacterium RM1_406_9]|nr:hypothetical protein [Leptolyngbyaceae cyanobacterium RM1_406_9]
MALAIENCFMLKVFADRGGTFTDLVVVTNDQRSLIAFLILLNGFRLFHCLTISG